VPQHVAGVVVAVGTQGLADGGIIGTVDSTAAPRTVVFACSTVTAWAAQLPGAVHGAEGRGSQGDEEPGAVADCGRDVLAAEEARADEVESVARVETRACGADGCPAVAAADEKAFAGFGAGVVVAEDFAGCAVQGGGGTGEVDGVGATAGGSDLLYQAGKFRVLGEIDCVAVCFGQLTQARRAVENGAPVSRGELRCDGGDLPGRAAEAARWVGVGAFSVMGITFLVGSGGVRFSGWFRCPGRRGSAAAVRSRSCGLRRPCSGGTSRGAWACRCVPFSGQVWEKPLISHVTRPWTV
jgi:hypothetical protein